MDVTRSVIDGITVITLSGELDGKTVPFAQEQIMPAFEPEGKVILELSQVSYMSSAGLRLMLLIHRQITALHGQLVLVGLAEDLQDTMSATGFLGYFTTRATLDEGLAALR